MTCRIKVILVLSIIALSVTAVKAVTLSHDDRGETEKSQAGQTVPAAGRTALAIVSNQPAEQNRVIDGDLASVDWNSLVGQNVTIEGDLVIVDTYDLARRGQVKVARNRLYVPTSKIDPNDADANDNSFEGGSNVAQVVAAQKHNDKATIIIDDGSSRQNIFPPKLFPELGKTLPSVRIGSTIKGVSGKLVKAGKTLLLVPNQPLRWTPAARPERPDVGKADVTVASFNVLNYFTTIDDGNNNARGADSNSELNGKKQRSWLQLSDCKPMSLA